MPYDSYRDEGIIFMGDDSRQAFADGRMATVSYGGYWELPNNVPDAVLGMMGLPLITVTDRYMFEQAYAQALGNDPLHVPDIARNRPPSCESIIMGTGGHQADARAAAWVLANLGDPDFQSPGFILRPAQ